MMKKLIELIEVRKIITFVTLIVFVVLSLNGTLQLDFIQNIVLMVIAFYFAKNTLDGGNK